MAGSRIGALSAPTIIQTAQSKEFGAGCHGLSLTQALGAIGTGSEDRVVSAPLGRRSIANIKMPCPLRGLQSPGYSNGSSSSIGSLQTSHCRVSSKIIIPKVSKRMSLPQRGHRMPPSRAAILRMARCSGLIEGAESAAPPLLRALRIASIFSALKVVCRSRASSHHATLRSSSSFSRSTSSSEGACPIRRIVREIGEKARRGSPHNRPAHRGRRNQRAYGRGRRPGAFLAVTDVGHGAGVQSLPQLGASLPEHPLAVPDVRGRLGFAH